MNKRIMSIVSLAFFVRLAAFFILGRNIRPDLWEYNEIALNILHKGAYLIDWNNTVYRSFCYPLYPALSAAVHFLTGENYFILGLCHIILSSFICYFVYAIAKNIFDEKTAIFASLMTALHPGLIVYSTKMHELTLVSFMVVFIFWYMLAHDNTKITKAVIMGLLTGLGILLRPTFIFFLAVYGLYLQLAENNIRRRFTALAISCVIAALVIIPWTLRNYSVHKRWIFITTSSAEHFWRGNNQNASGASFTLSGENMMEADKTGFIQSIYRMNEIQQYDAFRNETKKSIIANPANFLKLVFNKFCYFWWFSPQAGLTYPKYWLWIYKAYYSVIALFFALGIYNIFASGGRDQKMFMLTALLLLALVSALHSVYYIEMRHRWAVEPLMLILASYGMMITLRRTPHHL